MATFESKYNINDIVKYNNYSGFGRTGKVVSVRFMEYNIQYTILNNVSGDLNKDVSEYSIDSLVDNDKEKQS